MTDCYVCGHPILEGQKAVPFGSDLDRFDRMVDGAWLPAENVEWVHANPADHLSTLDFNNTYAAGFQNGLNRAAQMVEEFAPESITFIDVPDPTSPESHKTAEVDPTRIRGAILVLAERIKNGE